MKSFVSDSFNMVEHFVDRHIREGRGRKIAIRCDDSSWTYTEVAGDVNRVGNGLLSLGLQQEQRVLLLLPDCPEFAIAYFGVMKIGAVAVGSGLRILPDGEPSANSDRAFDILC